MAEAANMVDRIVAGVLEQLHAPATAAAPATQSTAAAKPMEIGDTVVTAGLLETRGILSGPVVFGRKAILTPSAVDFLSSRKIAWTRANAAETSTTTSATWLVVVSRSTPAVESALDSLARLPGIRWQRELVGCHREAARRAVGALCRGECDGAVAFTGKPESLVCHANRNSLVRAAVVDSAERVKRAKCTMGANLFAIGPSELSVFALRSLVREIVSGSKPAAPADWSE
jgi:hypothetical protein